MAEWRSLMDPGTALEVVQIKLAWWGEEIIRMTSGSPVHPITLYLAQMPGGSAHGLAPLTASVDAAAAHVAGVPLERAAELQSHAGALYGTPLLMAALLSADHGEPERLRACVDALAAAQYLTRAAADYVREARAGRILFAVDELLAAGIDNNDLIAHVPPPRLRAYLDDLMQRAAGHFAIATAALAPGERRTLRHLLVLAALGQKHLSRRKNPWSADFRWADMYNAWNTARRAAAAR
jgi:phytoene/squalene synthetase